MTEDEIRHGLEGNLCRCTGYHNIVKAIDAAQKIMHPMAQGRRIRLSENTSSLKGEGEEKKKREGNGSMGFEGIGASVRRKEDRRFLAGKRPLH